MTPNRGAWIRRTHGEDDSQEPMSNPCREYKVVTRTLPSDLAYLECFRTWDATAVTTTNIIRL